MHQDIAALIAEEMRDISECIIFKIAEEESSISIISGHLVDKNNQTIANATTTLSSDSINFSTTSDANGNFSFSLNSTLFNGLESFRITAIKPDLQLSGNLDIRIEDTTDFSNLIITLGQLILS